MKKLILLLGMLVLCFVPFWKQQWEERWDEMQTEKKVENLAPGNQEKPDHFYCGMDLVDSYVAPANGIDGKALFKANCAACHYASDKKSTGPGLRGSYDRIPGGNWKYDFIHDSQKMIKAGDPYANAISKNFNGAVMTSFPHLTNEEIDAILDYTNASE